MRGRETVCTGASSACCRPGIYFVGNSGIVNRVRSLIDDLESAATLLQSLSRAKQASAVTPWRNVIAIVTAPLCPPLLQPPRPQQWRIQRRLHYSPRGRPHSLPPYTRRMQRSRSHSRHAPYHSRSCLDNLPSLSPAIIAAVLWRKSQQQLQVQEEAIII